MRADQLLSPGVLSNGQSLRHESAHAISRAEINLSNGVPSTATDLKAYFTACADAITAAEAAAKATSADSTLVADDLTAALAQVVLVTFTAENAAGQPLANIPVTFSFDPTSTATGRTMSVLSGVTGSAGQLTTQVAASGAGNMVVDADVSFLGVTFNKTLTVVVA